MAAYRYQLERYKGPTTRHACPGCGQPRAFTRYLDTRTGELLPEQFGRCDRQDNCGYHFSPYHDTAGAPRYAAVERQRERTAEGHPSRFSSRSASPIHRSRPPAPATHKPVICIPDEVFAASLGHYDRNQFARLLRRHFGVGVAGELLARFQIGTSSALWPGAAVFWLIDHEGRKRGGQVVLFDEDGHTTKRPRPDGSTERCTRWVHTALEKQYERKRQPLPEWLKTYDEHGEKSPCLFGLPQLRTAPKSQPVAVVEAPKTAVLCTPYFPQFVWLAAGGLSYLNEQRMAPLKGRNVVLFPDLSIDGKAFDAWSAKAQELKKNGFHVGVSDYLEQHAKPDHRQAGCDLADFVLDGWEGYPPSWDNLPKN